MNRGTHAKSSPERIKNLGNHSNALSTLASILVVTVFLEAVEVRLPGKLTVKQIEHLHGEETLVYKSEISALFGVLTTVYAESLILDRMYPLSFPNVVMITVGVLGPSYVKESVSEPDISIVEDAKQDQLLVES